jgi:hypothetical protein
MLFRISEDDSKEYLNVIIIYEFRKRTKMICAVYKKHYKFLKFITNVFAGSTIFVPSIHYNDTQIFSLLIFADTVNNLNRTNFLLQTLLDVISFPIHNFSYYLAVLTHCNKSDAKKGQALFFALIQ